MLGGFHFKVFNLPKLRLVPELTHHSTPKTETFGSPANAVLTFFSVDRKAETFTKL